jgi:O-antigen/teichoic acid export membrane protein
VLKTLSFLAPYRKLLYNVTWLGLGSLAVKPLWLAFITVLCARELGAEGYGVFNTALSLAGLALSVTGFGVVNYTVREVAGDHSLASRFFTNFIALRLGLAIPAVVAALGVGVALGYDAVLLAAVGLAAAYSAVGGVMEYARSFFQAFEVLKHQALSVVAEKVLVVGGGTAMLLATASPLGTLFGMAAGMALAAAGTVLWVARRLAPFRRSTLDGAFVLQALRTLVPFGLTSLFGMLFFRVDTVMVEAIRGTEAAGQYGLAFRVVEALNMLPLIVVGAAAYPRLSSLFKGESHRELHRLVAVTAGGLLAVSLPIAAAVALTAPLLVGWIATDPRLEAATPVLQVLVWAFPLTSLRNLLFSTLLATDQQRFIATSLGLGVVFNVGLNLALIPPLGIRGAAVATLCSEVTLLAAYGARYLWQRRGAHP